jgi:enoyl-CoA hydratase/carnithine racemase
VLLDVDRSSGTATLTLNRPAALNAFTDTMEQALVDAFDATDAEDDVRAVVLTGAGRAFCAGVDLSDGADTFVEWRGSRTAPPGSVLDVPGADLPVRRDGGGRVALRIFDSLKPVVAAVNGPAFGVGATLALACDFRLASTDAELGFVFTRRGLVPESCSSWFLPRAVPMQVALDWLLTGRRVDAGEALATGLLRAVHPPAELLAEAAALAERLAAPTSPVSVALTRRMLWALHGAAHPMVAHEVETRLLNERGVSADGREGIASFLERRRADFRDRVSDLVVPAALGGPPFHPSHLEDQQ